MLDRIQRLILAAHTLNKEYTKNGYIYYMCNSQLIREIIEEFTEDDLEHIGIFTDETGNLEIGEGYRRVILTK